MDFFTYHMRKLVSFFHFLSIAIWFLFLYFKLWVFINAAVVLKTLNIQTVSFIVYSFLLVLFPATLIYSPKRGSKKKIFNFIFYFISIVILAGAIGDLFTYNLFRDYTYTVGDAVFCNILLGVPNIYGTICCLILSLAYFIFGKYLTENKTTACLAYLSVILIGITPALIYSFSSWGGFSRSAWVEKAAFIAAHQICLFISFLIASTSSRLWREHIK